MELKIEREFEFSSNYWDAADDVCAIDGGTVPGIRCSYCSRHEILDSVPVIACNCDGFVEVPVKAFDA